MNQKLLAHFDYSSTLSELDPSNLKLIENNDIHHSSPFQTDTESYPAYQRLKDTLSSNTDPEDPYKSFFCPLSGKVMKDPVMTSRNRVYDREEITKWIQRAQLLGTIPTDPITKDVLLDVSLTPLKSIRETIDEWRKRNSLICVIKAKKSLSDEEMRSQSLKQLLDACVETKAVKHWIFFENLVPEIVKCLTVSNSDVKRHAFKLLRLFIIDPGQRNPCLCFQIIELMAQSIDLAAESLVCKPPLLEAAEFLKEIMENKCCCILITRQSQKVIGALVTCITITTDPEINAMVEDILSVLSETGNMVIEMARFNYFIPFLSCLRKGSEESKKTLITFIAEMTLSREAVSFFVHNNVIADLVVMVKSGRDDSRILAMRALQNLSWHERTVHSIAREGLVEDLLEILASKASLDHKVIAASILEKLITILGVDQLVLLLNENVIPKLVPLLCSILDDLTLPLHSMSIHIFLLRILVSIAQDSIHIRNLIRSEQGCSDLLLNLLKPDVPEVCALALTLLYVLCDGNEGSDMASLIAQNAKPLVDLLENSTNMRVQNAITAVLSRLSHVEPNTISFLAVSRLMDLCTLSNANEQVQALAAISLYADDWKVQDFLAQKEFIVTLVKMLGLSTTHKIEAALILKAFSSKSYKLLNDCKKQTLTLRKPCPVHNGHCRVKKNFCIVQAGAVSMLVPMLDDEDSRVAEASLDVLSTLIGTDTKNVNAARFLDDCGVTGKVVQLATGKTGNCLEKSLDFLSRLFAVPEIKKKHTKRAILSRSGCQHSRCLSQESPCILSELRYDTHKCK